MKDNEPSKIDQLLDLLLDALQERHRERTGQASLIAPQVKPIPEPEPEPAEPDPMPGERSAEYEPEPDLEQANSEPDQEAYIPEKLPSVQLDRLLRRFMLILLGVIILINIPFNRYGTNLARAVPDEQSLVIRDGLVLKGSGEEIYVLQDNHKRWISSLAAFDYYGFDWDHVNVVDDAFLNRFPDGPALSLIMKCNSSVHIYAIENGRKRWIKDIPTFEELGYVWEDVQFVPCRTIDNMPDGPPFPPDAGQPPPG